MCSPGSMINWLSLMIEPRSLMSRYSFDVSYALLQTTTTKCHPISIKKGHRLLPFVVALCGAVGEPPGNCLNGGKQSRRVLDEGREHELEAAFALCENAQRQCVSAQLRVRLLGGDRQHGVVANAEVHVAAPVADPQQPQIRDHQRAPLPVVACTPSLSCNISPVDRTQHDHEQEVK